MATKIVTMFAGDHAMIRTAVRMLGLVDSELDSICDNGQIEENRKQLLLAMEKIAEATEILNRLDVHAIVSSTPPGQPQQF